MARKNMKRYPVQRMFQVNQASPAGNRGLIDIGEHLSKVNHRLYRQSRFYEAQIHIDADVQEGTTVDIYALADSWMVQKSLMLAKSAWDESNAEEKEMLHGKIARWNDFRVSAGVAGTSTYRPVLYTGDTITALAYTAGEFDLAKVVDQSGGTRTFTWDNQSPGATEYSIIGEYDKSGNTSADPETPATGPYSGLLPNLEPGAAAALQDDGNQPPYNATSFGSAHWVKVATLHLGAGRQRLSSGYFTAPSGLILVDGVGIAEYNGQISLEVKRGDYKGVHAPSMLE